jgi:EAL domain-containing protein (putative c-di-GMP-specific phosphodiesterase class I)
MPYLNSIMPMNLNRLHHAWEKSLAPFKPCLDFDFSFAFQPIVDAQTRQIVSYEALVRGTKGEPAMDVLSRISADNIFGFDRAVRLKAIHLASRLKLSKNLHINLLPFGNYLTNMNINATLKASAECGFPLENIIFEITESEVLTDHRNLIDIIRLYNGYNFRTAIDDFGTGYSGLKLLVQYQPNYVKLDRSLIANIDDDEVKKVIFQGIRLICKKLGIAIMAEGVERVEEYAWLRSMGVTYFQGYYFALPAFEELPEVSKGLFSW